MTINGTAAINGTLVSAWISSVQKISQATIDGKYGYVPPASEEFNVYGTHGDTITFKIYDAVVGTDILTNGDITEKNLSLTDVAAPTSSVDTISSYWKNASDNPLNISATASDVSGSGVATIILYYYYSADNSSWSSATLFGTDSASPWSWDFTFPGDEGYYRFFSIAADYLGNTESFTANDTMCGYDTTAPTTTMTALDTYKNDDFTVTWAINTEATSGVATYTVQHKQDSGAWSDWFTNVSYTVTSATWLIANTTEGCTVYFRALAVDNATNCGAFSSEISTTKDTVAPTVDMTALSTYKNDDFTVAWAINTEATSGVATYTVEYKEDAGAWTAWLTNVSYTVDSATWLIANTTEASVARFRALAVDNASNCGAFSSEISTTKDTVAPTVDMTALSTYKNADFTVAWAINTEATSGVATYTVEYKEDAGAWTAWLTNVSYTVDSATWLIANTTEASVARFRALAVDNASNCGAFSSEISTTKDTVAPTVDMAALSTYKNADFSVNWSGSDTTSGVATYTVQYKENVSGTWTDWFTNVSYTVTSATWQIANTTENCTVYFRALAVDNVSNCGSFSSEISTTKDTTAPTSSADTITGYWQTSSPLAITATASDGTSGVKNVTLYYRFSSDNSTWDGWTSFGVDTDPWVAISWSFNFPNDTGYYEFYSIAKDNATNAESAPGSADQDCGYDYTAPISEVGGISPYLQNTTLVTITTTGSDDASGVKNVTLYYYYSSDNVTFTGPFAYAVNDTLPWITSFYSFQANESGYYRFYSIAVDNATNVEDAPDDNDTMCYCNTPPDAPSDPYPENVTGVNTFNTTVTLSVYVFDPDADGMIIYFYNNATAQEIGNTSVSSGELLGAYAYCSWTGLNESTNYSWYAIANDSHLDNTSEIWSFTTGENEVILFEYHVETLTGDYQCLGVEFDGEYFWVTGGNNTNDPNRLYKFNSSGSLVADYSQPAFSTGWGWMDLAFDGTYLYASLGGNVSNQINQINCTNGSWTGVNISGPENGTRGLAYDPATDHFWSANWSSSIYEFNRSGDTINEYNNTYSIFGLAWDNVSSGGPWLWVYAQNCSTNGTPYVQILQFDPANGTYTNVTYQGLYYDPEDVAGGACFVENWEGKNVFVGLTQNTPDLIFGMKLNRAPNETSSPTPSNRSTGVSRTTDLGWTGGDPDGDTVTYDVYFGTSSSPSKVGSGNQSAVTYDPGTLSYSTVYYWKIVTWDNQSAKTEGPVWHFTTVAESTGGGGSIPPSNNAPTADANGPYTGYVDQAVTFNGTGSSDPDTGDTLTYTWDFGDSTTGTGATPAHTYNSTGLYNVTLTVSDGTTTDSDTTTANISELPAEQHPPVADANGPYPGLTYQNITFDGSDSSDLDGWITNYTWDFGDNTIGYGVSPIYSYNISGLYNITLIVIDNDGLADSDTTTATIALDSDGDGWSDDMETSYGTNATDATDYPTDTDGDGTPDEDSPDEKYTGDTDDDNDGLSDDIENAVGSNSKDPETKTIFVEVSISGLTHYLVDTNNDGTYDAFYNSATGTTTTTTTDADGKYLIDYNGDGNTDYIYDPVSGAVTSYEPEEEFPWTTVILIIVIIVIIVVIIAILFKKGYLCLE